MLGNDNVRDRLKHKLYVTCVCGTCDVGVDRLTTGVSVQPNKLVSDEIHSILVGVSSYIGKKMKSMNKVDAKTRHLLDHPTPL